MQFLQRIINESDETNPLLLGNHPLNLDLYSNEKVPIGWFPEFGERTSSEVLRETVTDGLSERNQTLRTKHELYITPSKRFTMCIRKEKTSLNS